LGGRLSSDFESANVKLREKPLLPPIAMPEIPETFSVKPRRIPAYGQAASGVWDTVVSCRLISAYVKLRPTGGSYANKHLLRRNGCEKADCDRWRGVSLAISSLARLFRERPSTKSNITEQRSPQNP
jgi:hypothetical protein